MSPAPRFPLRALVFAAALVGFAPTTARSMHAPGQGDPAALREAGAGVSFSLATSVGMVEGAATELAFSYPYGDKFKLSELTWDLKGIVMAGVHGSVAFGRRYRLNVGVWSALTEGSGMMVDRDWDYPAAYAAVLEPDDGNWTHESRHPDTSLDELLSIDQNLSVLALQAGRFSLSGIVGYKHDTWKWSARGGSFVYSYNGFRDYTGSFPAGEPVITYEQQYSIPYVGVGAGWSGPVFRMETHLLFSPVVSASDSDYHVLRDVHFDGDFSGGTFFGLGLNATWAFARHWSAAFGVEYQSIPQMIGNVTITDGVDRDYYPGGSGVAMSAASVALGAGYRF